jgi:hypothetical protein
MRNQASRWSIVRAACRNIANDDAILRDRLDRIVCLFRPTYTAVASLGTIGFVPSRPSPATAEMAKAIEKATKTSRQSWLAS